MKCSLVINLQQESKIFESTNEFLESLGNLAKDCNFKTVTAESYCEESIKDALLSGLSANLIRQRLLEERSLNLKTSYD